MKTIYVKLLDEGVDVYRPVKAMKINNEIYKLEKLDDYHLLDEDWEFLPESCVNVIEKRLENDNVLVAIRLADLR